MDTIRMVVAESGHAFLDQNWRYQKMCSPFSRLYYVKEGEGILELPHRRVLLQAGYAYLIPAGLEYDYRCENHMEKWYFHVNIPMPDGFDLFQGSRDCYEKPCQKGELERVAKWYDRDSLEASFALYGLLTETMAAMIQAAGLAEKEMRIYSPMVQAFFSRAGEMISSALRVGDLAQELNISPSTLAKRFKKETGMAVGAYLDQMLFNQACQLLLTTDLTVCQISDQLDFCDQFYFSRYFKRHQGETPTNYRKRMRGI